MTKRRVGRPRKWHYYPDGTRRAVTKKGKIRKKRSDAGETRTEEECSVRLGVDNDATEEEQKQEETRPARSRCEIITALYMAEYFEEFEFAKSNTFWIVVFVLCVIAYIYIQLYICPPPQYDCYCSGVRFTPEFFEYIKTK